MDYLLCQIISQRTLSDRKHYLPADVGTKISEEIKEKKLPVDFDTVVG